LRWYGQNRNLMAGLTACFRRWRTGGSEVIQKSRVSAHGPSLSSKKNLTVSIKNKGHSGNHNPSLRCTYTLASKISGILFQTMVVSVSKELETQKLVKWCLHGFPERVRSGTVLTRPLPFISTPRVQLRQNLALCLEYNSSKIKG